MGAEERGGVTSVLHYIEPKFTLNIVRFPFDNDK